MKAAQIMAALATNPTLAAVMLAIAAAVGAPFWIHGVFPPLTPGMMPAARPPDWPNPRVLRPEQYNIAKDPLSGSVLAEV
jgi:hypothetical protein